MSTRNLTVSFHFTTFCIYLYANVYNFLYVGDSRSFVLVNAVVTKLIYLTVWGMIIQALFFGYSVINTLFGSNLKPDEPPERRSAFQKFRDFIVATIVFPIGCFVVITFWSLYAIDRELVFPKALDAIVPPWLNHVMHTTVILFLLIEKFFVYHHYPSRGIGLGTTVGFALVYQTWLLWIAYYADIWVYPILMVLAWPGRVGFFVACWLILIAFYLVGEKLTDVIWKTDKLSVKKHK